jgi:hypothetical protein
MISVMVDGERLEAPLDGIKTMGELIELVKATIDPDTIIVELKLEGKPLLDSDWRVPLSVHSDSMLEISTGDKQAYFRERLHSAEGYLERIMAGFSRASDSYASCAYDEANQLFKSSVDDLLAFVNWYVNLLSVSPEDTEAELGIYEGHIRSIQSTCEQLLQQQMFQSWSMLGETLEKRLNPELALLREFCRETSAKLVARKS